MTEPSPKDKPSSAPDKTPPETERLPFEGRAAEAGVTGWRLAALPASAKWATGQEVTAAQFAEALDALDKEVIE